MTFETINLHDNDLISLFKEFQNIIEYTSKRFTSYPPYTFHENSTTGFLVAACGKLGFSAIQEYRTAKPVNGRALRGDILIFINEHKAFRIEAKLTPIWGLNSRQIISKTRGKVQQVNDQIADYKELMIRNCENEDYLSLIYLVPSINQNEFKIDEDLNKAWNEQIEEIKKEFFSEKSFLISIHFNLSELNFVEEYNNNKIIAYPGILILGEIIPSK